ncbi:MAG: hypothetical protein IKZ69_03360, partial [Lachnospiraceae bacterium]|nr:hypothetical protein [Lachnospiraceae bacterium]
MPVLVVVSLMLVVLCVMTAMADGETEYPVVKLYNARGFVQKVGYVSDWIDIGVSFGNDVELDPAKVIAKVVDPNSDTGEVSDIFEVRINTDTSAFHVEEMYTGVTYTFGFVAIKPKEGLTPNGNSDKTYMATVQLFYDVNGDGLDADDVMINGTGQVFRFTVTNDTLIETASCTFDRPVVGQLPNEHATVPEGAHYTVTLRVKDASCAEINDVVTWPYEEGVKYTYLVDFEAKEGYRLTFDTVYSVNGEESEINGYQTYNGTWEHVLQHRRVYYYAGQEWYDIAVNGGEAYNESGGTPVVAARPGDEITLVAANAPENQTFDHWAVNSENVTIADPTAAETTMIMGEEDVEITAVFAELQSYKVWIGGVEITNANRKNILNALNNDNGKPTATASYDAESNTLTVKLNGADLRGVCQDAVIYSGGVNLVLDIEGGLTIKETGYDHLYAIFVEAANLTINGSLTAESQYGNVIESYGDLTAEGDLTLTSSNGCAISAGGSVVINGNVTAEAHSVAGSAILTPNGNVTITGDTVSITNEKGQGVNAKQGTVTITGSVMIKSGTGAINAKAVALKGTQISVTGNPGITTTEGAVTIEAVDDVTIAGSVGAGINGSSIDISGGNISVSGSIGLQSSGGNIIITGDTEITATTGCILAINFSTGSADNVSVKGNLTCLASDGYGIWADNIDITGSLKANTRGSCVNAINMITIDGDVDATANGNAYYALTAAKVKMVSGTWTLTGAEMAIYTKPDGITIPATHGITLPENGKLAEKTDANASYQTVADADGNPAKDVKIAPASFSVTVTDNGYGSAQADISSGITGTVVTLTATPNEGYRFKEWNILEGGMQKTDDGAIIPGIFIDANGQFTLETKNVKIEAVFEPLPKYTVTVTADPAEGGSVSGGGLVQEDDDVTVTATPNEGYSFKYWAYAAVLSVDASDPKVTASTSASYTFRVTDDIELVACFEKNATTDNTVNEPEGTKPAEGGTDTTKPAEGSSETTKPTEGGTDTTKPAEGSSETTKPTESGTDTTKPAEGGTDTTKPAESGTDTTKPAEGSSDTNKQTEEVKYTVVSGDNGSVTQGSDMTIIVKRSVADETCINHFTGVQIDGKDCAASDYDAKAGSTVVTLKAATIQTLSTGTHTVTVLFDDGKAETKLIVKAATSTDNNGTNNSAGAGNNSGKTGSSGNEDIQSPKTGDKFTDGIYV